MLSEEMLYKFGKLAEEVEELHHNHDMTLLSIDIAQVVMRTSIRKPRKLYCYQCSIFFCCKYAPRNSSIPWTNHGNSLLGNAQPKNQSGPDLASAHQHSILPAPNVMLVSNASRDSSALPWQTIVAVLCHRSDSAALKPSHSIYICSLTFLVRLRRCRLETRQRTKKISRRPRGVARKSVLWWWWLSQRCNETKYFSIACCVRERLRVNHRHTRASVCDCF